MNGSDSNTSGSNVGNVAYWPTVIFQKAVDVVGTLLIGMKRVLSGELTLAALDFSTKAGSDAIADAVMEEIARRLIVTIETKTDGNVVFSQAPPDDHSKVWWQIDGVTSIPIGSPKIWDETSKQWVNISAQGTVYVPPRRRSGSLYFPAGNGQQNYNFADLGTTDYEVNVLPTTFLNGVYNNAPGTFPTHFGWTVVNKTNNQVSIAIFGCPTGGLNFEIDITERVKTD